MSEETKTTTPLTPRERMMLNTLKAVQKNDRDGHLYNGVGEDQSPIARLVNETISKVEEPQLSEPTAESDALTGFASGGPVSEAGRGYLVGENASEMTTEILGIGPKSRIADPETAKGD